MIGRRAVIGLSLLSALLLCAFAAQSASAAKSTNTTAFTCKEGVVNELTKFSDAHCDKPEAGGPFGHELIKLDTTTAIDGTNEKVTESTKKSEPAKLNGELAVKNPVEIVCQKVKNDTTKSFIHNVETEKKHTVTGTARTEFSECEVKIVIGCKVVEPIISEATFEGVEGLEGPKKEPNAMGVEFKGEGEGETFAVITFKNDATCAVKGQSFKVQGSVIATSGPGTEEGQVNKHSGSTLVFNNKFGMQKLTFNKLPAEFQTIATAKMAGPNEPAISLTTVT